MTRTISLYTSVVHEPTRCLYALRVDSDRFRMLVEQEKAAGRFENIALLEKLANAFLFEDPEILRASRLGDILHGCGKLFASSTGSADAYSLSSPVNQIDWFLSHNWCVGRWRKFLAIALYFHAAKALGVTLVVVFASFFLTASRRIPCFQDDWGCIGVMCLVTGVPSFVLTLLVLSEIPGSVSEDKFFLDKTCIHQTDVELNRKGIAKLGAFLRRSKGMLVIFSEVYLHKLWTVYEVACFLMMKPEDPIAILPLFLSDFVFSAMIGNFLLISVAYGLRLAGLFNGDPALVQIAFAFMQSTTTGLCLRAWALEKKQMQAEIESFRLEDTICTEEADRAIVYHHIAMFMQAVGLAPTGASEEEALNLFSLLVREYLGTVLRSSLARFVPYRYAVALFLTFCTLNMDTFHGRHLQHTAAETLHTLTVITGLGPLWMFSIAFIMKFFSKMNPWLDRLFVVAVTSLTGLVFYKFDHYVLVLLVLELASESMAFLGVQAATTVLLMLASLACWGKFSRTRPPEARPSPGERILTPAGDCEDGMSMCVGKRTSFGEIGKRTSFSDEGGPVLASISTTGPEVVTRRTLSSEEFEKRAGGGSTSYSQVAASSTSTIAVAEMSKTATSAATSASDLDYMSDDEEALRLGFPEVHAAHPSTAIAAPEALPRSSPSESFGVPPALHPARYDAMGFPVFAVPFACPASPPKARWF